MYRNTMYISTKTSWLHSQWHWNIATKNRIVSLTLIKHFSSRYRTSNKNNTEYRTSVQKLLCYTKTKKTLKRNKLRNNFFTVTVCNRCQCSRHLLNPKFRHYPFWTLLYKNWCYKNCNSALQQYPDFKQSQ